ncbi:hypothetical protein DLP14_14700 [Salmonella enterica]|nr:hypothetical protein [Salmonella enterica]EMD7797651.1 hypothetical protein [Salmonella enterica]
MKITSQMPVWVTVNEAADIINSRKKPVSEIKPCDLYRYALYGDLTFSIYFQSPIKLRKVTVCNDRAVYTEVSDNIIDRVCYLCNRCILNNENLILKTEGSYISPPYCILDASLHGQEYAIIQKLLARCLDLPEPVTGLYNIHHGVLVKDEKHIYQIFERASWQNMISRKLNHLPPDAALLLHDEIKHSNTSKSGMNYFPVYHFPEDACFVIRMSVLERFIDTCFPAPVTASHPISTPLSRLLWLACKHNDLISSLIDHPYKLISVFEQWAAAEGMTDRLSGDTLKKALKRGRPL